MDWDWPKVKLKAASEAIHWAIAFLIAAVLMIAIVDVLQVYFIAKNAVAVQQIENECRGATNGR